MKNEVKRKILEYPAVFSKAVEGGYNVSFPDFPGCVTFGKSFEEAKTAAAEVLKLWLEQLRAQKTHIPEYTGRPIIDAIRVQV